MRNFCCFKAFPLYLCASLLLLQCLRAQSVQGIVTGTITDPAGAAVPNAHITLTNEGTNVSQEENSANAGEYRFPLVPPGTYTLTVKAPGFNVKETKSIVVDASQTVPVDVRLDIATSSTAIEVVTQATVVQTATSDLATTVNTKTIEETPLLTRNVFDWPSSPRRCRKA